MSIRGLTKYDTNINPVNPNLEFHSQTAPGLIQAQAMKKSDLTTSTNNSMTSTLKKPAPQDKKICVVCGRKKILKYNHPQQDKITKICASCYAKTAAPKTTASLKVKKICGICGKIKFLKCKSPLDKTTKICASCYGKAAASLKIKKICGICGKIKFLNYKNSQDTTTKICGSCYIKAAASLKIKKICGICGETKFLSYYSPLDKITKICRACYIKAAASLKIKKICGICGETKFLKCKSPLDKTTKICRACYDKAAAPLKVKKICGICGETKFLKCKSPLDKTTTCCNACYQKVYQKSKQNLKAASHKDVDCNEITSSPQHKKNSQDQTTKLYNQRYQKVTGTKSADTLIQATSLSCKRKSDRPTDLSPRKSLKPSPPCEQFPLTRISHPLLRAIAAPLAEIAPQIDKDSVLVIRPCLSEGQGWGTQCASAPPREYEKCGLTPAQAGGALPGFNLLSSIPFTPSALELPMQHFPMPSRDDLPIPLTPLLTPLAPLHLFPTAPLDLGLAEPPGLSYSDPASTPQGTSSVTNPPSSSTSFDPDTLFS